MEYPWVSDDDDDKLDDARNVRDDHMLLTVNCLRFKGKKRKPNKNISYVSGLKLIIFLFLCCKARL